MIAKSKTLASFECGPQHDIAGFASNMPTVLARVEQKIWDYSRAVRGHLNKEFSSFQCLEEVLMALQWEVKSSIFRLASTERLEL